jgi:hypothetical protein
MPGTPMRTPIKKKPTKSKVVKKKTAPKNKKK